VLVDVGERKLVVKLRGSAEGVLPLVSEIVVGELAEALGLATPARYLVELAAGLGSDDPHEELRDLLERSVGLNLGFQWLEGFRDVTPADAARVKPELAAAIVWLDALVQNPDRTARNPNLLIKSGQIWLIDHGAALPFHHDWQRVTEQSPREVGSSPAEHLFKVAEPQLLAVDAELAPKIERETLQLALSRVPDDFLTSSDSGSPERVRAAYVAYLWKRLRSPRPFVMRERQPFQFG
jgi:hypothetical protein